MTSEAPDIDPTQDQNPAVSWEEQNLRYLMSRVALVHLRLQRICSPADSSATPESENGARDSDPLESRISAIEQSAARASSEIEPRPALDRVCAGFNLSPFERDILVMCAAMELDAEIPQLCATAHRDSRLAFPSFNLAFAAFPEANWIAIAPAAALRRWRLIEIAAGDTLTSSALRIDERVLHYILGVSYLDERLEAALEPIGQPVRLPQSQRNVSDSIAAHIRSCQDQRPVIQLSAGSLTSKRSVAAVAAAAAGQRLYALRADDVPVAAIERELFARLCERESILGNFALLIESEAASDQSASRATQKLARDIGAHIFVAGNIEGSIGSRTVARFTVPDPDTDEQRTEWYSALGPAAARLNGQLDSVISQFRFDATTIRDAATEFREWMEADEPGEPGAKLWQVCRNRARASLDGLAERIETRAVWDDLILPDEQMQTLGEIVAQVRQRIRVYDSWGFANRNARGLGISALFCGPSGTGKTLAAEVLAGELRLDLYRIDLSQVVSKYIGETEKNLRRVFDAAEHSGAVLLFDEADALFGKRSEVKDSHDRYANIEVSYLLQRMEAYRGLAVLTTNRRSALDAAFLRRIRFVVSFPFPDPAHRARIWARIFPADMPREGLEIAKLAKLNVTGGNIQNIALNAAFLAADLGEPVRMTHLLRSARSECAKIEKQLTAVEIGGWL